MTEHRTPEGRAWWQIHQLAPRGKYEHPLAYQRRVRKRVNFLARVQRRPNGCWVWVSTVLLGADGVKYPIYYHRRESESRDNGNTTRAAFPWMMREWFPEVPMRHYEQTEVRCGDTLCINPYHRVRRVPVGGLANGRMDHKTIRAIYAQRHTSTVSATAREYGLHTSQVSRIWTGVRWSAVTGHFAKPVKKRLSADVVLTVYGLRTSGRSTSDVGREFGVSKATISAIWNGHTWAHTTKHGLPTEQTA